MSQPTYIGSTFNTGNGVTGLTVTKTTVGGDFLVLAVALNDGSQSVTAVTDSAGNDAFGNPINEWIMIAGDTFKGTRLEYWACKSVAGVTSVLVTLSGAQIVTAGVIEYTPVNGFGIFATQEVNAPQNPIGSANIQLDFEEVGLAQQTLITIYSVLGTTFVAALAGTMQAHTSHGSVFNDIALLDQQTPDVGGNLDTTVTVNQDAATYLATSNLIGITLIVSSGFTLSQQPGFSDLKDTSLDTPKLALGIQLDKIINNAAFGMCRTEFFTGYFRNGDTVSLPVSSVDGYNYTRDELIYIWGVSDSFNANTLWMSGKDTIWYAGWKVDQLTGDVFSEEWYRRSGAHYDPTQSNDGGFYVVTVAQRLKNALTMASVPTFGQNAASDYNQDKALKQGVLKNLNNLAKLAVVNSEIIYMGEFVDGDTIPQPVSPADGYTYNYGQVSFATSWRWTTDGSGYSQPPLAKGQLGPMQVSTDSNGNLSVKVSYIEDSGSLVIETGYGRVAVFAMCSRITSKGTQSYAMPYGQFTSGTIPVVGSIYYGYKIPLLSSAGDNIQIGVRLDLPGSIASQVYVTTGSSTTPNGGSPRITGLSATLLSDFTATPGDDYLWVGTDNPAGLTGHITFKTIISLKPAGGKSYSDFQEIPDDLFYPGSPCLGPTMLQLDLNANEALLSREFFGPVPYADGSTVTLPISPSDGYKYQRSELTYVWDWGDTTNQTGAHLRLPAFSASVDQASGAVSLIVWRLADGGPVLDDNNTLCRINVIVIGHRQATPKQGSTENALPPSDMSSQPADLPTGSGVTFNGV